MNPFCRLCFKNTERIISLETLGLENFQNWALMFLGLEIDFIEGYPKFICCSCFSIFKTWANQLKLQARSIGAEDLVDANPWWDSFQTEPTPTRNAIPDRAIKTEPVDNSPPRNIVEVVRPNPPDQPIIKIESVYSLDLRNCFVPLITLDDDYIQNCTQGLIDLSQDTSDEDEPVVAPVKTFSCPKCDLVANSSSGLKIHLARMHPELKSCPHCHLTFTLKMNLTKHLLDQTCTKEKSKDQATYFCPRCPHSFEDIQCLSEHIKIMHRGDFDVEHLYACSKCKQVYLDKKQLDDHYAQTHNTFECTTCNVVFACKFTMMQHVVKEHPNSKFEKCYEALGQGSFGCIVCSGRFSDEAVVTNHFLKFHYDMKSLLRQPENLNKLAREEPEEEEDESEESEEESLNEEEHNEDMEVELVERKPQIKQEKVPDSIDVVVQHNGEEAPSCKIDLISQKMIDRNGTNYEDYFSSKKDFKCIHCNQKFRNVSDLTTHLRARHRNLLLFMCSACGTGDFRSVFIRTHHARCQLLTEEKRKTILEEYKRPDRATNCTQCHQSLAIGKNGYFQHFASSHPSAVSFSCPGCKNRFLTPTQLLDHISTCSNITVTKGPPNLEPSRYAGGRVKLNCPRCASQFVYKTRLLNHIKKFHPDENSTVAEQGKAAPPTPTSSSSTRGESVTEQPAGKQFIKCTYCPRMFPNMRCLNCHIHRQHKTSKAVVKTVKTKNKKFQYKCTYCPRIFYHAPSRSSHQKACLLRRNKESDAVGTALPGAPASQDESVSVEPECDEIQASEDLPEMVDIPEMLDISEMLVCELCELESGDLGDFSNHLKRDHGIYIPTHCITCQQKLSSVVDLKSHVENCNLNAELLNFQPVFKSASKESESTAPNALDLPEIEFIERPPRPKKKRPHTCHVCDKKFSAVANLNVHMAKKHFAHLEPLQRKNKSVAARVKMEARQLSVQCETCGQVFPSEVHLLTHEITNHTTNSNALCKFCDNRVFPTVFDLISHIKIFHPDKVFQCHKCGRLYFNKGSHDWKHHNDKDKNELEPVDDEITVVMDFSDNFLSVASSSKMPLAEDNGNKISANEQENIRFSTKNGRLMTAKKKASNKFKSSYCCDFCPLKTFKKTQIYFHIKKHLKQIAKRKRVEEEKSKAQSKAASNVLAQLTDPVPEGNVEEMPVTMPLVLEVYSPPVSSNSIPMECKLCNRKFDIWSLWVNHMTVFHKVS